MRMLTCMQSLQITPYARCIQAEHCWLDTEPLAEQSDNSVVPLGRQEAAECLTMF